MKRGSGEERAQIIAKLRDFFGRREEIIFAYIHGSFSEALPYRDIDIGVFVDVRKVSKNHALEYGVRISAQGEIETGITPLDVKVINYAPVGFRYFATKGIVIVSRNDEMRYDFLEKTWKMYFDLLPKRRQIVLDLVTP